PTAGAARPGLRRVRGAGQIALREFPGRLAAAAARDASACGGGVRVRARGGRRRRRRRRAGRRSSGAARGVAGAASSCRRRRGWRAGRLYVPREVLQACGAAEADLAAGRLTPPWVAAIERVVLFTRSLFERGRFVCDSVRGRLGVELRFTWLGGARILERVER